MDGYTPNFIIIFSVHSSKKRSEIDKNRHLKNAFLFSGRCRHFSKFLSPAQAEVEGWGLYQKYFKKNISTFLFLNA